MKWIEVKDIASTWPSLEVGVELAPWHWRVSGWLDHPLTLSGDLQVGPLRVRWFSNKPAFVLP